VLTKRRKRTKKKKTKSLRFLNGFSLPHGPNQISRMLAFLPELKSVLSGGNQLFATLKQEKTGKKER
jgi:hypothetical protein